MTTSAHRLLNILNYFKGTFFVKTGLGKEKKRKDLSLGARTLTSFLANGFAKNPLFFCWENCRGRILEVVAGIFHPSELFTPQCHNPCRSFGNDPEPICVQQIPEPV